MKKLSSTAETHNQSSTSLSSANYGFKFNYVTTILLYQRFVSIKKILNIQLNLISVSELISVFSRFTCIRGIVRFPFSIISIRFSNNFFFLRSRIHCIIFLATGVVSLADNFYLKSLKHKKMHGN